MRRRGPLDAPWWLDRRRAKRPSGRPRLVLVRELAGLCGGCSCHYCGRDLELGEATLDHIWPFSLGGTNGLRNLVLACLDCNVAHGADPIKCLCKRCRRVWLPIVNARLRLDLAMPEGRSRASGGPQPARIPAGWHGARGSAVQG